MGRIMDYPLTEDMGGQDTFPVIVDGELKQIKKDDLNISDLYIHGITSTTSILELFNVQKRDTIQSYFIGSYTLLTDYPASLINEQGTVYPFVTIEKPHGIGYIRITAVTAGGTPKQITGYTNGDVIIWGNVI